MRWGIVLCGLLWIPVHALAGEPVADPPRQVRCESKGLERRECPLHTADGVQLVRQLSDNSCIRGSAWDIEPGGVWVALGCRAEFASSAPRPRTVTRRVVRCESDGRQESCPVVLKGAPVRLLRQLSAWPCKEGRSWGVKRNEIWVSRGCNGEFEVGAADGSGFVDAPRLLTCESKKGIRRLCGTTVERGVRLQKQTSRAACVEDQSWGWSRDGVWVDDGCRGEFVVN